MRVCSLSSPSHRPFILLHADNDLPAHRAVAGWLADTPFANLARESLSIGGWVAMWRPLEVFLYDWWPIRAEARLFDRLALMPVEIRHHVEGASEG